MKIRLLVRVVPEIKLGPTYEVTCIDAVPAVKYIYGHPVPSMERPPNTESPDMEDAIGKMNRMIDFMRRDLIEATDNYGFEVVNI